MNQLRDRDIRPALIRMIAVERWRDRLKAREIEQLRDVPDEQLERVLYQMYDAGELPGSYQGGVIRF